jgi:hypothetical protein
MTIYEMVKEFAHRLLNKSRHSGMEANLLQKPSRSCSHRQSQCLSFPDQGSARGELPAAYDADMGDAAPDNVYVRRTIGLGVLANSWDLNKAKDRSSELVLHRVRGQSRTERINSHVRAPKRTKARKPEDRACKKSRTAWA